MPETSPSDTLSTRLTELLRIKYPIMLAGMGGIAYAELVSAVSTAGGFGTLGASAMRAEKLAVEVAAVRARTDRPFGVNALTAVPEDVQRFLPILIDGGASVYVAGLGVPSAVITELHRNDVLVGSLCGKTVHAQRAVDAGIDFVIATGTEGGGHTGTIGTIDLVPAIVDAVGDQVPVVASGGIVDGRGLAAALALGADGVWVGTRFAASVEARQLKGFHDAILSARDDSTVLTRAYSGKTMRVLQNEWTKYYEDNPAELLPFPEQRSLAIRSRVSHLGASDDSLVDPSREAYLCGQGAAMIDAIVPAREIVDSMIRQAVGVVGAMAAMIRND